MEDARDEQRRVNAAERRRGIKQQDADQAVDSTASKATDPHNVHRVVQVVAWAAVIQHVTNRTVHCVLSQSGVRTITDLIHCGTGTDQTADSGSLPMKTVVER